jgi:hypothetical protein
MDAIAGDGASSLRPSPKSIVARGTGRRIPMQIKFAPGTRHAAIGVKSRGKPAVSATELFIELAEQA